MRCFLFCAMLLTVTQGFAQWKNYKISVRGDTLNRLDQQDRKQGPWINHYDQVRGEPGYEEEGYYKDNQKEGEWKLYSLAGDLVGIENYRWGFRDGVCQYYTMHGDLRLIQSWKALNPNKLYDTIEIEDLDKLDTYRKVVIKNEGAAIKHGTWKYFDPETGALLRSETYTLGKLEGDGKSTAASTTEKKTVPKPKEIEDFEKKNSGKKKIRVKDGSTGG
ncbi:MAG: hypothetical protein QM731_11450 [Chitinophagaceae bacterium]